MNTTKHESATLAALATLLTQFLAAAAPAESLRLESPSLRVEIDAKTGRWSLLDKAADVRWPSTGAASPGAAKGLEGDFQHEASGPNKVRLVASGGAAAVFELADDGRSVVLRYEGENLGERRVLEDAVSVTDAEKGAIVVPCREGLLIPADSGQSFEQTFGASEYEGCHMNMLEFLKTTHEVLGPLHAATAHERLGRFEFVAADRSLQRAVYGEGESATAVVVNFGRQDAKVHSRFGGEVLLPPWGFAIDARRYAAFYAKRWNGRDYPDAALFTLQAINGQGLATATPIRVFHGFGDPKLVWGDVTYEVRRQAEIGPVARAASSAYRTK